MTKLRSILYIESDRDDFKIDVVTNLLNIIPNEVHQKGEVLIINGINKKRLCSRSRWKYEIEERDVKDIKESLIPLLNQLLLKKEVFVELKKKYNLEMYISLVLHIKEMETPAMSISAFALKSLDQLCLELDFDLYYT
jgi:hypothetical protein